MINYRCGIFETNSSSTHSLFFATDKEYKDFTSGKTVLDRDNDTFVPWNEAIETIIDLTKKNGYENLINDDGAPVTFEEFRALDKEEQSYWMRDWDYIAYNDMGKYLEYYDASYTTEHGDTVYVFGEYGNDY